MSGSNKPLRANFDKTATPTILSALRRVYAVASPGGWRDAFGLLLVMCVNAGTEVIGVASVLPLVAAAANPSRIHENALLSGLYATLGFSHTRPFLIFLGAAFLALVVITNAINALTWWLCLRFGTGASHRLSNALLTRYLCNSYAWFLRRNTVDLTRMVIDETDQLVERFILTLTMVAMWGMVAVALIVGLLILDPLVAIVSACALSATYVLIYRFFESRSAILGQTRTDLNGQRHRAVQQALGVAKEARAQPDRGHLLETYRACSARYIDVMSQHRMIGRLPSHFTETLAIAGIVTVLIYLVSAGRDTQLAVPMASLYLMATWRLVPALQHVYSDLVEIRFYLPLLYRMDEELRETHDATRHQSNDRLRLERAISVQDVSFAYDGGGDLALRGIELVLRKGESTALIGRTGAGKTTLADIIAGHLTPRSGTVYVDDAPLTTANTMAWQRNIGYVPQEIFIVDDTVRANIALGVPPARVDEAALERAVRMARLDDLVLQRLDGGYETILGERGVMLSGGERQRIGIARALYHDPQLLIFDEATSSLDNLTESEVMTALRALAGVKTIVVIAHRLSTVQACDKVCLMENGAMVAVGTYDSLLEKNASMRDLARTHRNNVA